MTDYDFIHKKLEEEGAERLNQKIKTNTSVYESAKQEVNKNYNYAIDDAEKDYEDDYRENAVQKKVNEFYIKEEMANMGLSDSGLSRSHITANQLSYSNRKNEIDRARQSMVDGLTREMTSKVAELENERILGEQDIRDTHAQQITSAANDIYTSKLEAETAAEKAQYDYLTSLAKTESDERIAKYKSDNSLSGEREKTKYSNYSNIMTKINDGTYDVSSTLDAIYSYVQYYDLDLDSDYYTNSEITTLLNAAGIKKSLWKNYYEQKFGLASPETAVKNAAKQIQLPNVLSFGNKSATNKQIIENYIKGVK